MYRTSTFTDPTRINTVFTLLSRDIVSVLNLSVSRRFFETSHLVSVLKFESLSLVLVSTVLKNRTCRSHLGLEDITSPSRSRDFSLVNIHSMHQTCGYITKKIMDLTYFTSWCFKVRHCSLDTFFGTSRSRLGLESLKNGTSQSRLGLVT